MWPNGIPPHICEIKHRRAKGETKVIWHVPQTVILDPVLENPTSYQEDPKIHHWRCLVCGIEGAGFNKQQHDRAVKAAHQTCIHTGDVMIRNFTLICPKGCRGAGT